MRKLLVFQHAASEPLGVLDPMLRRWGFPIRYRGELEAEAGADGVKRVFHRFIDLFEWRPTLWLASL